MAYRLKPAASVEAEVRRVASKQLLAAIAEMRRVGDRQSDEAIHDGRRRVKKVRALIRMVQTSLGDAYGPTNKRLRVINRLLAPIADGAAVVDTIDRLGRRRSGEFPRGALAAIRAGLSRREARIDLEARANRVLPTAARLLRAELARVESWRLHQSGFGAVAAGLTSGFKGARRAMALASQRPTIGRYHSWRRRVKDHWFMIRLLEGRCGGALATDRQRIEALDGHLGEYHNCALLRRVLISDALVPRRETAQCLRALRRYEAELREAAQGLGLDICRERPRAFVERVRRLWRAANRRLRAEEASAPCRQAA